MSAEEKMVQIQEVLTHHEQSIKNSKEQHERQLLSQRNNGATEELFFLHDEIAIFNVTIGSINSIISSE